MSSIPTPGKPDCGSKGVTSTIDGDVSSATAIASCTVFSGSIAVATNVAGTVNFDGIQEILENLVVENVAGLSSLGSDSLRRVDGNFTISNVETLNTLDFPLLAAVDTINFDQLPSVSTFNFSSGLSSVTNVFITNTSLSTLEGINLQNADNIQITDNAHLIRASLPLETAKDGITVSFNGPLLNLSLPQLTSAGHIILRNIAAVSLPSLNFLSGIFTLIETSVTELALDSLSVASLNLTLLYNENLTTTSFQGLLSAGSIYIVNNTELASISFDKLSEAVNITIEGGLTSVDIPALTSVNETFILESTDPNFNCSTFDAYHTRSVIKGDYSCLGTHQAISQPSSGLSGSAIAGVVIGCLVVAIAVTIGVFFFIRRRKRSKKESVIEKPIGTDGKAEMDNQEVPRKEMPTGEERHELTGEHGVAEIGGNAHEAEGETYELQGETAPRHGSGDEGGTTSVRSRF